MGYEELCYESEGRIKLDPPTPASVDELAKDYLELKDKLLQAQLEVRALQEPLDKKADELRELVREHGSAHAEKSKLLHGISYEVMCSFGQSVSIDAAAVETFREALVKSKQARLLKRIYQKTIRWTLAPDASAIIRNFTLAPKLSGLFAACQVVKDKTPTLIVREKNA